MPTSPAPGDLPLPASSVDRAALAFSVLPHRCAETVNRRLSIAERVRLREGLVRVRDASDEQRVAAIRVLYREVRRGLEWPRPSVHDDTDCPFAVLTTQPRARVVEVLDRLARREPLAVAVTLCHLPADVRAELWSALPEEARSAVVPALDEVHGVSTVRTRAYARDITNWLARAMRRTGPSLVASA
jgi:hypothetical protein